MLDAIGIICEDLPTSIEFYKCFGLEFNSFGDNQEHWEATTPSGTRIMLDSVNLMKSIQPDFSKKTGNSIALAFKVDAPDTVDNMVNELVALGGKVTKTPFDAFWGQRYANIEDPDGNPIDIFADT
ncbi:MAG: VOC family protein [Bdellovibrionales bacterium]